MEPPPSGDRFVQLLSVFDAAYRRRPDGAALIQTVDDASADGRVRYLAARQLWRLGEDEASAPVLRYLQDDEPWVRSGAARSAGHLKLWAAIPDLLAIAEAETETERERYHALEALAKMREARAVPILRRLFARSPRRTTRRWTAQCAVRIGGREAESLVKELYASIGWLERMQLRLLLAGKWPQDRD